MKVTNTHSGALGLPTGQVLVPNTPTQVKNWDKIKDNAVVKAWIRNGVLSVDGGDVKPGNGGDPKAALIESLAKFQIKADKRKTVEQLQAMLAEAEEKAKAQQNEND